jgi:hypothetical protein
MKKNLLNIVILMVALGLPLTNFAQWNINNSTNDRWTKTVDLPGTNNDIRRVGVGNFILDGYGGPKAALHVNENLLTDLIPTASNYYTPGHLFRTDGPSNQDNMWQMFTGPDATATEKARLFVPANTNDFVVQASEIFGTIRFNLGGLQRMILRDGLGQVHVGIGNNFTNPQHMIHVHTTPLIMGFPPPDAMIGFTHNLTGSAATDGFLVGINSEGTAELRQWEDKDIVFYTGNTEQMIISSDNNIKINSLASNNKNYVIADENGTLMLYALDINETKISELETRIIELEQKIYKLEQLLALQ